MCFNVSVKNQKPLVAKRDITCYKLVFNKGEWGNHNGYEAACQEYAYYLGRTTKRVVIKPTERTEQLPIILKGYHSYRSLKVLKEEQLKWHSDLIPMKMIIPKGTIYYKNDREYVSERLKCIGLLK